MKTKTEWTVSDTTKAKYLGLIEFQSEDGEFHDFEVLATKGRLIFGGSCNVGFIESGYMEYEVGFETRDEALAEMLSDLETYYNHGPAFVDRIICNERM